MFCGEGSMLDGLRIHDVITKNCNNGCSKQKEWNEQKYNLAKAWDMVQNPRIPYNYILLYNVCYI